MKEQVIYNEFIYRLGEWVCIHDEDIHFAGRDASSPQIKLDSQFLRIRANKAFKGLSLDEQECMIAHELGHREYQHYLKDKYLKRMLSAMANVPSKEEIEADSYAAKLVGKNRYLSFLRKHVNKIKNLQGYTFDLNEFRLRIQALEKIQEN